MKKTQVEPILTENYHQFLENSSLAYDYLHLSVLEVILRRFINFPDFISYNLDSYFKQAGLFELFAMDAKTVFIHL